MIKSNDPLLDIFFAGNPAIVIPGSVNDLLTTELAPIAILSPISISPNILTPGPI
jgi:hypothetical protein